jgi:hypothetical protein
MFIILNFIIYNYTFIYCFFPLIYLILKIKADTIKKNLTKVLRNIIRNRAYVSNKENKHL